MRVLLLSAYDASSHRYWRQLLTEQLSDWEWVELTLPARHFSWRMRGNALYWSQAEREVLQQPFDLLLATSTVDLATLRGLHPTLTMLPTLLYFHENQFAYPPQPGQQGLLEMQITSLYSALAADVLIFNSDFNRQTFLQGVASLLQAMPDFVPTDVVDTLTQRAVVLPVPIAAHRPQAGATAASAAPDSGLQLVWNHRWEYDKGPDELLDIAQGLTASGCRFTLHVVGQQFRRQPESFARLRDCLRQAQALGHWGYIAQRSEYEALLLGSDVVLSSALHDFQGLAVLEACALGCSPLVPDRVVYPEWFGQEFRYSDVDGAVAKLGQLAKLKEVGQVLPHFAGEQFSVEALIPRYRAILHSQAQRNSVL